MKKKEIKHINLEKLTEVIDKSSFQFNTLLVFITLIIVPIISFLLLNIGSFENIMNILFSIGQETDPWFVSYSIEYKNIFLGQMKFNIYFSILAYFVCIFICSLQYLISIGARFAGPLKERDYITLNRNFLILLDNFIYITIFNILLILYFTVLYFYFDFLSSFELLIWKRYILRIIGFLLVYCFITQVICRLLDTRVSSLFTIIIILQFSLFFAGQSYINYLKYDVQLSTNKTFYNSSDDYMDISIKNKSREIFESTYSIAIRPEAYVSTTSVNEFSNEHYVDGSSHEVYDKLGNVSTRTYSLDDLYFFGGKDLIYNYIKIRVTPHEIVYRVYFNKVVMRSHAYKVILAEEYHGKVIKFSGFYYGE